VLSFEDNILIENRGNMIFFGRRLLTEFPNKADILNTVI